MMVMRRKTGWEHLKDNPIVFFEEVLMLDVSIAQRNILRGVAAGVTPRVGLIWGQEDVLDEASFLCGMMLWRAAACRRPTLLIGGRRSMAGSWIAHAGALLAASRADFRSDVQVRTDPHGARGLLMVNGTWAIRYDGPFLEDTLEAVRMLGGEVDVMLGDFTWTDKVTIHAAVRLAEGARGVCSMAIGQDASR